MTDRVETEAGLRSRRHRLRRPERQLTIAQAICESAHIADKLNLRGITVFASTPKDSRP